MGSVAGVRQHLEFMRSLNLLVQWPRESRAVTQSLNPRSVTAVYQNHSFPPKVSNGTGKEVHNDSCV